MTDPNSIESLVVRVADLGDVESPVVRSSTSAASLRQLDSQVHLSTTVRQPWTCSHLHR